MDNVERSIEADLGRCRGIVTWEIFRRWTVLTKTKSLEFEVKRVITSMIFPLVQDMRIARAADDDRIRDDIEDGRFHIQEESYCMVRELLSDEKQYSQLHVRGVNAALSFLIL